MDDDEHCIDDCLEAAELCEEAAVHLLRGQPGPQDRALVDTLIVAAAVGSFLADLIRDDSELARTTVSFLADACRRAAAACREAPGDELLGSCADACDRCANCAPRRLGVPGASPLR